MSVFQYLPVFSIFLLVLIATVTSQAQTDKDIPVERYRQEALARHNFYRSQCNAEPLQQNTTLDNMAQAHCNSLASRNAFNHSGTIEYGENSYKKDPWDFQNDNGATPVDAWYSERPKYDSSHPESALHFTQVVWAATKHFGVGICRLSHGGIIFVANYYPRGNYKDQFVQNVKCSQK